MIYSGTGVTSGRSDPARSTGSENPLDPELNEWHKIAIFIWFGECQSIDFNA